MYSYSHFNPNLILLFTPTVQFYYWIHSTPSPTFQLQHYSYFLLPLLNPTTGSIPLLLPLFNSNPTPFLYSSVQPYYWIYSTPTPTFQLQHYSYFLLLLLNLTTGSIQLLLPPFNSNPTPTAQSYYWIYSTPTPTFQLHTILLFTPTAQPYYLIYSTPTPSFQLQPYSYSSLLLLNPTTGSIPLLLLQFNSMPYSNSSFLLFNPTTGSIFNPTK